MLRVVEGSKDVAVCLVFGVWGCVLGDGRGC